MNNNTNITYERVLENANTIRDCSRKMEAIFNEFTSIMNQVTADDVFMGQAANALQTQFNSLKGRFNSYTQKVEEFANTITHASEETSSTEKNIANSASNLAG